MRPYFESFFSVILGVISIVSKVDRETKPDGYSLIVTARDHGYPIPQSSTALVNVTVSDVNDNAPRFDKFTYLAEVREDSDISMVVTVVHAVDGDEGLAGEIVYSITGLIFYQRFAKSVFKVSETTSNEVKQTDQPIRLCCFTDMISYEPLANIHTTTKTRISTVHKVETYTFTKTVYDWDRRVLVISFILLEMLHLVNMTTRRGDHKDRSN